MKTAKIFKSSQGQVVRLPMEFKIEGAEVFIKKQGDSIILFPINTNPWDHLTQSLHRFSDDFMTTRD